MKSRTLTGMGTKNRVLHLDKFQKRGFNRNEKLTGYKGECATWIYRFRRDEGEDQIPLFGFYFSPLHSTNRSSTGQFRIVRREPRSTPQCTSWIICSGTGISKHVRYELYVVLASVHLSYSQPSVSGLFIRRTVRLDLASPSYNFGKEARVSSRGERIAGCTGLTRFCELQQFGIQIDYNDSPLSLKLAGAHQSFSTFLRTLHPRCHRLF